MFESCESAKIFNPFSTPENPEYLWSYISMSLHSPWFFVTYTQHEGDESLQQILFIMFAEDLEDLKKVEGIQINNVYLVSPPHLNKSDHWRMESLEKILTGLEPEYDQPRYVYILENGNRYLDSGFCEKESELRSIEVAFISTSKKVEVNNT